MTELARHLYRHWTVACMLKTVRDRPISATVLGTPLVLYRAGESIVAAEDRCPHRNAPLSSGTMHHQCIRCPYHGWQFDAQGKCVAAPGAPVDHLPNVGLKRWKVMVSDDLVWVASPEVPPNRLPYQRSIDASYRGFTLSAELTAGLGDAIENLLDGTHTPFVHAGLVRKNASQQPFIAIVRRLDDRVEAEYRGEPGQNGLISRLFEPPREVSFGRYVPPFTAELEYRSKTRTELFVVSHFTPTVPGCVKVFATCYLPPSRIPDAIRVVVARTFFSRVLHQDRSILRLQYENITKFREQAYVHWSADLLRPWIDAWLANETFPPQPQGPQEVPFEL